MHVYKAILKRRSIRRFKPRVVPYRMLKKLVNAARLAPSGANLQPCEYVAVSKKSLIDEVFATLKWAGYITPKGNPPPGKRPMAYIVVLVNTNIRKRWAERDVGAAIENIILTGVEEGLGSCWLGSIDKRRLRKILNVPGHCQIDSVIALGYPDEKPVVEPMKDSIKYWKDARGKLHVPKRKLEDILHKNTY